MRDRRELTRYGVPAAYLAAVTIAVLLIKAGLTGGGAATTTTGQAPPPTTTKPTHVTTTRPTASQYYTIQSGDTFGEIALRQHTTVDDLLRLNPGIDPLSLRAGSRIRVH